MRKQASGLGVNDPTLYQVSSRPAAMESLDGMRRLEAEHPSSVGAYHETYPLRSMQPRP